MSYYLRENEIPEQRKARHDAEWEQSSYHDSRADIFYVVMVCLVSFILSKGAQPLFQYIFFALMLIVSGGGAATDFDAIKYQSKIKTNYSI